jgi:hypothetical protein
MCCVAATQHEDEIRVLGFVAECCSISLQFMDLQRSGCHSQPLAWGFNLACTRYAQRGLRAFSKTTKQGTEQIDAGD